MVVDVTQDQISNWLDELEGIIIPTMPRTSTTRTQMGSSKFIEREYTDRKGNVCNIRVFAGRKGLGGRVIAKMKTHYGGNRRVYPQTFIGKGSKLITIVKTGDVEGKYKEHITNALLECKRKSNAFTDPQTELASYPNQSINPKARIRRVSKKQTKETKDGRKWAMYEYELELEDPLGIRCYHAEPDFVTLQHFGGIPSPETDIKLRGNCSSKTMSKSGNVYYGRTDAVSGYAHMSPIAQFKVPRRRK